MKQPVLLLLLIFLTSWPLSLRGRERSLQGLYFSSYEVVQDQRTSLDLTPKGPFEFPQGFSLEFEVNFRRGDGFYGYIFRMIGDRHTNIDLVFNGASEFSNLWLVYKDEILANYKWEDLPTFDYDQWMKARITFDFKNERLTLLLNEKRQEIQIPGADGLKKILLSFGACKYKSFYSADVCPMTVRNIRLYKADGRLYRQWELGRHAQNKTYDTVAGQEATVENPAWLIDRYLKWQKIREVSVPGLLGVAYDAAGERLFFVNGEKVYTFFTETMRLDSVCFLGSPYRDRLGRNILYNDYTDEIWSYSFAGAASRFDFRRHEWSAVEPDSIRAEYAHHNRFFSPLNQALVTILGYGYYEYKSRVNVYDSAGQKWESLNRNAQIEPRYLSAAGFLNKREALVFGGYGSKSGRQELSPTAYYDLYTFDLSDYSFHRKWTLEPPLRQPFVPSENLVADSAAGLFYTLVFNNGYSDSFLQLAEFSIDKPEMTRLADSIPLRYRDTDSWTYLLLNERKSDLIAIVSHTDDISLYTLPYRPIRVEDAFQPAPGGWPARQLIPAALFLLLLAGVACAVRRRLLPAPAFLQKKTPHALPTLPPARKKTVSAVYLLGEFLVYNRKGENITPLFSQTLKQLFLLILLSSVNKKGILSAALDEILWRDKLGESARNNRNVNLSKLRSLLESVGGIEIVNANSLWNIRCSPPAYCDYLEAASFTAKVKNHIPAEEEIIRFLSLLQAGVLLPDLSAEWLRPFQEAYAKEMVEALGVLLSLPAVQRNSNLRYSVAESLINIDALNDEALSIVCSILHKQNKQSRAKRAYESFAQAYEKGTGLPYPTSYSKFIRKA